MQLENKIELLDKYFKYLFGLKLKFYNIIYFEEHDMINEILEKYYDYRKEMYGVSVDLVFNFKGDISIFFSRNALSYSKYIL